MKNEIQGREENVKLSLIVPCYNEQENIRAFYDAVKSAFADCDYTVEILFVNDGSKDETGPELKRLFREKQKETRMTMIHFSRNFGKEAAIYAGLHHFHGQYAALVDADLQQRPEIVRTMVEILDTKPEYDCVTAYQEERIEGKGMTFFKKMFYRVINRVSEVDFVTNASDFRCFRRNVAEAILELPEYHRFSKGLFSWVGFDTFYMAYVPEERHAGTSKWTFWKLFRYAVEGIVGFSTKPLQMTTFLGAVSSVLSALYFLVVVIKRLAFGVDVPGYATIVALLLLIGGIQMLMLGIMGEYIARMYIEGKRRPVYIEKLVESTDAATSDDPDEA